MPASTSPDPEDPYRAEKDKMYQEIKASIEKVFKRVEKKAKRRKKRDVDPLRPKNPMSSFFMYKESVKEELKSKYPKMSVIELAAKAGQMWTDELSEVEKGKWKKKYQQERAKVAVALHKYNTEKVEGKKRKD